MSALSQRLEGRIAMARACLAISTRMEDHAQAERWRVRLACYETALSDVGELEALRDDPVDFSARGEAYVGATCDCGRPHQDFCRG